VKRCIGIPGDKIEIRNGQVFINDKMAKNPELLQFSYQLALRSPLSQANLDKLDITDFYGQESSYPVAMLNSKNLDKLRNVNAVADIQPLLNPANEYDYRAFPHLPALPWNRDNYGPIVVPKEGVTVPLNKSNVRMYERIIRDYEDNKLEVKGEQVLVNGAPVTSYTFKQNYYFMMGDNRHNSLDSRFGALFPTIMWLEKRCLFGCRALLTVASRAFVSSVYSVSSTMRRVEILFLLDNDSIVGRNLGMEQPKQIHYKTLIILQDESVADNR
jgi:signal peptidase I